VKRSGVKGVKGVKGSLVPLVPLVRPAQTRWPHVLCRGGVIRLETVEKSITVCVL
jgi:hypothetical protein